MVRHPAVRPEALRACRAGDDARALPQLPGVSSPQGAAAAKHHSPALSGSLFSLFLPLLEVYRAVLSNCASATRNGHRLTTWLVLPVARAAPVLPGEQEVVVSPQLLHQNGIPYIKVNQKAREARQTTHRNRRVPRPFFPVSSPCSVGPADNEGLTKPVLPSPPRTVRGDLPGRLPRRVQPRVQRRGEHQLRDAGVDSHWGAGGALLLRGGQARPLVSLALTTRHEPRARCSARWAGRASRARSPR